MKHARRMEAASKKPGLAIAAGLALLLCACVDEPTAPTVAVMPAPNKPFSVFQDDQAVCKQYASQNVSGGSTRANDRQIGTAVLGTVLGAGLGAAIGGGQGAAIGAGGGTIVGAAAGSDPADRSQDTLQHQYDIAYSQCMYSRGNQVPGYAFAPAAPPATAYPPPPPAYPPAR